MFLVSISLGTSLFLDNLTRVLISYVLDLLFIYLDYGIAEL